MAPGSRSRHADQMQGVSEFDDADDNGRRTREGRLKSEAAGWSARARLRARRTRSACAVLTPSDSLWSTGGPRSPAKVANVARLGAYLEACRCAACCSEPESGFPSSLSLPEPVGRRIARTRVRDPEQKTAQAKCSRRFRTSSPPAAELVQMDVDKDDDDGVTGSVSPNSGPAPTRASKRVAELEQVEEVRTRSATVASGLYAG